MSEYFTYDVFLSHSSKDKAIIRPLAEKLRADGVRVWYDEWEIRPGDSIPAKIEEGLEQSRVLALCMSANAFGSDWAQLESGTFRFRDPLNKGRRFLPLKLDDAKPKASLEKVLYIDWRVAAREQGYGKLLTACSQPKTELTPEKEIALQLLQKKIFSLGHTGAIRSVAFSPDGLRALSGSVDKTVRLWDVESGRAMRVLEGHTDRVNSVTFSPDGLRSLSGSADKTVRLWDVESGRTVHVLEGHAAPVYSVAFSPDGLRLLSGSHDNTVRLWDVESGRAVRVEGHSGGVNSVVFSPNGLRALSGSDDNTVRVWDVESGRAVRVLEGHTARVLSVAFSLDGSLALSGSADKTVRVWDVESGRAVRVLEGHSAASILSVAFSPDGSLALFGSKDKTVLLWEVATERTACFLEGHSASVWSVTFSHDGSLALTGSEDNTVRLWNLPNGHGPRVLDGLTEWARRVGFLATGRAARVLQGHSNSVFSVAFSTDGSRALSVSDDKTVRLWEVATGRAEQVLQGYPNRVCSVAFSPDGLRALSGSDDKTVRLWDLESGRAERLLEGHTDRVMSVTFSPDGLRALSGSDDNTVRLWNMESGRVVSVLEGHTDSVNAVAFSPDGLRALSGSTDKTVRLWNLGFGDNTARLWALATGRVARVLEGHTDGVHIVAFSPDGLRVLSGSNDKTVRLWDLETGLAVRVLEGHSGSVYSVAFSPDGLCALSGSADKTVRLWDVESGHTVRVLEGHSDGVLSVAFSPDGKQAFSAAANGVMRIWDLDAPTETRVEAQTKYTNAKVLLVGDSQAGKTGLSMRLAHNIWKHSDSTLGAWSTRWSTQSKLLVTPAEEMEREIWLWDFGGQADQRLIHQLYMEDTALAVLVFDGQKEDLFESLGQWDRDLTRASTKPFTKLLAAGRVDTNALRVSRSEVDRFVKERGFSSPWFETSAFAGTNCEDLKQAIIAGIDWTNIEWRSSPLLFKRLKEEIIRLKDEGRVLMRFNELRDALRLRLAGEEANFKDEELKAVVGLLAGPGVVWELKFGSWVLLQPEQINAYAQAVIQTLRTDEDERGCLAEDKVLSGDLTYHSSMERLPAEEERFVLLAMVQTLVERGLCLREQGDGGPALLIFPSYYRRERPVLVEHPAVLVSYQFNGFLDDIYATLVVRLHHTKPFDRDKLWRYAADFKTKPGGKQLGIKLTRRAEGAGELEVYFDPDISMDLKIIFSRYVHEHLQQKAQDVVRLRHYVCPHCGTPAGNLAIAMKKLAEGKRDIPCVNCEKRIPLWDQLEELFADPKMQQRVRELQEQSALELSNESKDRALVGEVTSTVALAGQLCREVTVSDKGIDMEIEFNDDAGNATGKKLYLQLKSGDSHLKERNRDGEEVFTIKKERHATYWMAQAFPVMLVIRNSEGEIRWMEVRDWLKKATDNGQKPVKQIIFEGERFDVMSVRRWRHRLLNP